MLSEYLICSAAPYSCSMKAHTQSTVTLLQCDLHMPSYRPHIVRLPHQKMCILSSFCNKSLKTLTHQCNHTTGALNCWHPYHEDPAHLKLPTKEISGASSLVGDVLKCFITKHAPPESPQGPDGEQVAVVCIRDHAVSVEHPTDMLLGPVAIFLLHAHQERSSPLQRHWVLLVRVGSNERYHCPCGVDNMRVPYTSTSSQPLITYSRLGTPLL